MYRVLNDSVVEVFEQLYHYPINTSVVNLNPATPILIDKACLFPTDAQLFSRALRLPPPMNIDRREKHSNCRAHIE